MRWIPRLRWTACVPDKLGSGEGAGTHRLGRGAGRFLAGLKLALGVSLKMVGGAGFEPAKAEPADLQSAPFGRLGIRPYPPQRGDPEKSGPPGSGEGRRWRIGTDACPRSARPLSGPGERRWRLLGCSPAARVSAVAPLQRWRGGTLREGVAPPCEMGWAGGIELPARPDVGFGCYGALGRAEGHRSRCDRPAQACAVATCPARRSSGRPDGARRWGQRRDSNPQPSDYKSDALPIEPRWQRGG